ncbi:MAG: sigma-E processing peptidase SpoIIGA [Christensenellaceae bacterium]
MEIYLEYAIIDNFVMDFILLTTTHKILKKMPSYFRIIMTAIFSTTVTLILATFSIKSGYMLIIKLFLLVLITLISSRHDSVFAFFKFMNVFLLLTFFCGGIIFGVMYLLDIDYFTDKPYLKGVLPVGLNVLIMVAVYKTVNKIALSFLDKISKGNVCLCIISANGKSIKLNGLIDSGNLLYDVGTALPVVVCSKWVKERLRLKKPKGRMTVQTINGESEVELYSVDKIVVKIGNESYRRDAVLGVTDVIGKDYQIIIGCSLI